MVSILPLNNQQIYNNKKNIHSISFKGELGKSAESFFHSLLVQEQRVAYSNESQMKINKSKYKDAIKGLKDLMKKLHPDTILVYDSRRSPGLTPWEAPGELFIINPICPYSNQNIEFAYDLTSKKSFVCERGTQRYGRRLDDFDSFIKFVNDIKDADPKFINEYFFNKAIDNLKKKAKQMKGPFQKIRLQIQADKIINYKHEAGVESDYTFETLLEEMYKILDDKIMAQIAEQKKLNQ